ncbi:hypothetical protein PQX77_002261 [Marasmius sp. AFHP31]|nr:hypothetical protein PQX77_002261 [Marasmius sp. AFHP31]
MSNIPFSSSTNTNYSDPNPNSSSSAVPIAVPFPKSPRARNHSTSRRSTRSTSTYSTSSQSQQAVRPNQNPSWRSLSFSKTSRAPTTSVSVSLAVAEPQLESLSGTSPGDRQSQSELALANASTSLSTSPSSKSSGSKGSFKRSRLPSSFLKRKPSRLEDMFEERVESVEGNATTEVNATTVNDPSQVATTSNVPIQMATAQPILEYQGTTTATTASATVPQDTPDLPLNRTEVAPKSNADVTPTPATASTSWFASFGRSKGREANSNVTHGPEKATFANTLTEEPPLSTSVDPNPAAGAGAVEPITSTSSNTPQSPPSTTIPIPTPDPGRKRSASSTPLGPRAKRSWFTSASPSSPSPLHASTLPSDSSGDESDVGAQEAPRVHRRETVLSTTSIPSSIDERVPSLARTPDEEEGDYKPPALSPSLSADGQATVRARMNSLNPSSSRFSITLPLLGRQKVKLEDAVKKDDDGKTVTGNGDAKLSESDTVSRPDLVPANVPAESVAPEQSATLPSAAASESTSSTGTITTTTTTANILPTTSTASTDARPTKEDTAPEAPPSTSQWEGVAPSSSDNSNSANAATARYSWWDYVGWGSSESGTVQTEVKAEKLTTTVEESSVKAEETMAVEEPTKVEEEAAAPVPMPVPDASENPVANQGDGEKKDDERETAQQPQPQSSNNATAAQTTSSGSWFGWGSGGGAGSSSSTAAEKVEAQPQQQPQPQSETQTQPSASQAESAPSAPIATPEQPPARPPPAITPTLSTDSQTTVKAQTQAQPPVEAQIPMKVATKKPGSVFSSDTMGAKSGSWFAPWSWGTAAPIVTPGEEGGSMGGISDSGELGAHMTESEKIKEEALARQKELDEQREREEREREEKEREERERQEREEREKTANPLDAAISSRYSSGWASLFATVSMKNKMIKDHAENKVVKRDENGMEVMDLDLDEAEGTGGDAVAKSKDVERLKAPNGTVAGSKPASIKSAPAKQGSTDEKAKDKASPASPNDTKGKQKAKGPPPTITVSDDVRREGQSLLSTSGSPSSKKKKLSPTPSVKSAPPPATASSSPTKKSGPTNPAAPPRPPNLVLPTWADTFHTPPRSIVPRRLDEPGGDGMIRRLGKVGKWLLGADGKPQVGSRPGMGRRSSSVSAAQTHRDVWSWEEWGKGLPRALDVLEGRGPPFEEPPLFRKLAGNPAEKMSQGIAGKGAGGSGKEGQTTEGHVRDVLRGCKKVVVIGIHGWFPGAIMRTMLGEVSILAACDTPQMLTPRAQPTGTSPKFVNMMVQALEEFQEVHGVKLEKITKIPLEGEGTIDRRVEKLYNSLLSNKEWMSDLHNADAILVATHSQGSVVSTHLLDRLIKDRHIRTSKNAAGTEALADLGVNMIPLKPQRVCCLALCGIHLGPLRYLSSSALVQPYIQYFESTAARELFDFQDTESEVSKSYVKALENVVNHGTKMVYVASLDDQVVPIYSGLFTAASHPLILRALYIDGDAYTSSDFLSNLLVLLLRVLNCGLSDSGLLAHLSDVTAGTLSGVGHSTAYEELSNYALAVNYLFLTNDGLAEHPELRVEPFNAGAEQNDYEIPWALRDLIADEKVARLFTEEISQLRDAFRDWNPKTAVLKDVKRKLQPIQKLPSTFSSTSSIIATTPGSVSKL